jgi:hypothetical protein
MSHGVFGIEERIAPPLFFNGCRNRRFKGFIALTSETDYDQTAMGLPPITWRGSHGRIGIWDALWQ